MSNLIPDIAVRGPWPHLRTRTLLAAAIGILSVAAVTAAALVPTLIIYQVGGSVPGSRISGNASDTELVRSVADSQALLAQLAALGATSTPAAVVADIVAKRPKDVAITHITFSRNVPQAIVISGKTARRDAVNEYRSALASDTRFSSVSVPINALVGTQDGSFSLTVTGTF